MTLLGLTGPGNPSGVVEDPNRLRQCRICLESAMIELERQDFKTSLLQKWWSWPAQCGAWARSLWQNEVVLTHKHGPNSPQSWVAPCRCKGTQRWVHVTCLRVWQRACMKNKCLYKATTCSVCKACYTLAPPREPLLHSVWQRIKGCRPVLIVGPALFTVPMLLLLQIVLASVVFATIIGFVKNMFTYKASVHPRPQPIVPVPPRFDLQAASVRRQLGQQQDQGHRPARQTPSPRLNRPADRVRSAQLVGQGQEQLRQQQQQQQQLENHHESNQDLSYMERLLRTGCLLKATRANAVFAGATVLLESVDTSHETHGVVLNRELQGPALESARSVSRAVVDARAWIGRGGPHANNVVTVVHEAPALPGASQLGNDVCIGHYATLRHLEVDPAEVTRRNPKLRVLLGRVRWPNAEQLVSEIRQGLWNVSSTQATTQNTFVDCRSPRSATH